MCGILAILGIAGGADSFRHRALKLSRMMRHRGPDWNGIYCEGNGRGCPGKDSQNEGDCHTMGLKQPKPSFPQCLCIPFEMGQKARDRSY